MDDFMCEAVLNDAASELQDALATLRTVVILLVGVTIALTIVSIRLWKRYQQDQYV